jgi:hypothetical protein
MDSLMSMRMPARKGKILQGLEGEDFARCFAVIGETKFVEFQVVDGEALAIGCMKGENDLIDGDTEAVGLCALLLGGDGLRICATCVGKHCEGKQATDDLSLMGCAHV